MSNLLESDFFKRPVLEVAPDLLGTTLCTRVGEFEIYDIEAYDGPEDKACHGRFSKTDRTEVMFGPAGVWYTYLIYGMYWMLNVVTGDEGYPAAVLIRGIRNKNRELDGPGKLTKYLSIDKSYNGMYAKRESGLWIEKGSDVDPNRIIRSPRVGIDYAEEWKDAPYRFSID